MAKQLLENLGGFNRELYFDDSTFVFTYSEGITTIKSISFHISEIVSTEVTKETKEGMINRLNNSQIYYVLIKLSNNNIVTIPCKHLIQATGISNNLNDVIQLKEKNPNNFSNPVQFERYEQKTSYEANPFSENKLFYIVVYIVLFIVFGLLITSCYEALM